MDAVAVGFITTGATLLVTVFLFAREVRERRQDAQRLKRSQVADHVLATVERTTRAYALAPLSDLWASRDLEYALLLPRLFADLPAEDRDLAVWVARQVQLESRATNKKAATTIAVNIATKVIEWSQQERDREWFKAENARDPFEKQHRVPRRAKVARTLNAARGWAILGALLAAAQLSWDASRRPVR